MRRDDANGVRRGIVNPAPVRKPVVPIAVQGKMGRWVHEVIYVGLARCGVVIVRPLPVANGPRCLKCYDFDSIRCRAVCATRFVRVDSGDPPRWEWSARRRCRNLAQPGAETCRAHRGWPDLVAGEE